MERIWKSGLAIVASFFLAGTAQATLTCPPVPEPEPIQCTAPDSEPIIPTAPLPPEECATGRNRNGWDAGFRIGRSQVQRLWATLGEDPDRYDELVDLLTDTIPSIVASYTRVGITPYTQCRVQGYLDSLTFQLQLINPIECVIDGGDWATIMAQVYCSVSIELGGIADGDLLLRRPAGVCGGYFEATCEDVYRHVATDGTDPIDEGVAACLDEAGFDLEALPYLESFGEACRPYTLGAFASTFATSVHNDCSYEVEDDDVE